MTEDREDTVNIGGRTIANLLFADDIDGLAGEEKQHQWYQHGDQSEWTEA